MSTGIRTYLCVALLATVAATSNATAAWVEVETDNFVFLGETSEKSAKRFLRDLEIYRRTVLALVGVDDTPEQRKVRVFGLRGSGDIARITGRKQIAGIYTDGDDYPVFVTDLTGGIKNVRATSYHEFAHHILNSYGVAYYPRWYNEGYAEFLASFETEKDRVIIGRPSTGFAYALNDMNWLDTDIVIGSVTDYPFESNGSYRNSQQAQLFYGISWLAVHYIQNTPELREGFGPYLASLNRGADSIVAFEENFNISLDDFTRELRQYWRKDRFTMFHFDATSLLAEPAYASRKVEEPEVERRLAEIRAMFLTSGDDGEPAREKARKKLKSLIEEFGNSVEFSDALTTIAIREDDHERAVALAEASYAEFPEDTKAIQTLADALFHNHPPGGIPTEEDYLRSRTLFAEVIARDPMNPTANNHYPATFVFAGEEPDEIALRAVNVDLQFNRNPSNFSNYLQAAEIYKLAGRLDYACALIAPVELWIRRDAASQSDDESADVRTFKNARLEQRDRLKEAVSSACPDAPGES